jgi:hypothetical protein
MSKQKLKLTAVQAESLASWIDDVASRMSSLSDLMKYYGGYIDGNLTRHAREMAGAAKLARGWARAIREHR